MAEPGTALCPSHLREARSGVTGGDHAALSPAAAQALTLYSERAVSWLIQVSSVSRLGAAVRKLAGAHRPRAVTGGARHVAPPERPPSTGWRPGPPGPPPPGRPGCACVM